MSERQAGPSPDAQTPPVGENQQAPAEFVTIPFTAEGLNRVARSIQVIGELQDKRFRELESRIHALEEAQR